MPKHTTQFVCQSCGAAHVRWSGKCDACGEWNTLVEEAVSTSLPEALGLGGLSLGKETAKSKGSKNSKRSGPPAGATGFGSKEGALLLAPLTADITESPRMMTGISELDRVLGGGLVTGAAILVGGDPGIGKSTLLLQAVAAMSRQGMDCVYFSGEESLRQIGLRAGRLGLVNDKAGGGLPNLKLAAASSLRDILGALETAEMPGLVVIDSIQTLFLDTLESAPGTVSQVRACGDLLVRLAKQRNFALFLVGHVTKDGQIAGPRVLEHMVDTVLYFEGERGHRFRILRAVKNRFGGTDEIGVFEMTGEGLQEVSNPSALFLSERGEGVSGAAVFAGMEGSRPVLVEIQALVGAPGLGNPRRAVVGWDSGRLAMLLAVLEARCGVRLSDREIYLNVAGGLKISEPAADLAVLAAILSALADEPIPADAVIFGEVGLSGEVRQVAQAERRLREAEKLGFKAAIYPKANGIEMAGMRATGVRHIKGLVERFLKEKAVARTKEEV